MFHLLFAVCLHICLRKQTASTIKTTATKQKKMDGQWIGGRAYAAFNGSQRPRNSGRSTVSIETPTLVSLTNSKVATIPNPKEETSSKFFIHTRHTRVPCGLSNRRGRRNYFRRAPKSSPKSFGNECVASTDVSWLCQFCDVLNTTIEYYEQSSSGGCKILSDHKNLYEKKTC